MEADTLDDAQSATRFEIVEIIPPTPTPPPAAGEGVLLWILLGLWALEVAAAAAAYRGFLVLSGASCAILSGWAARKRVGGLALGVLVLVPLLDAFAYRSPLLLLLALPPIVALARRPRRALFHLRGGRAVVLGIVLYLAIAPGVDAAFRSTRPEGGTVQTTGATSLSGPESRRLGGGPVLEERYSLAPGPNLSVIVIRQPGSNLDEDLVAEYGGGIPTGSSDARSSHKALPGGWTRVDVTVVGDALGLGSYRRNEIFLLKMVEDEPHPTLTPPFVMRTQILAGYHLGGGGGTEQALRDLAGNVTVDGRPLVLPPEAFERLDAGSSFYRVPAPVWGAIVAAALACILLRRSRG
jgi:hypothetical protein